MNAGKVARINCPICDSSKSRYERLLAGFQLERCAHCGLVFVNPRQAFDAIMSLYKEKEDPQSCIDVYQRIATSDVLARYDRKLALLERRLGQKGRLLDFACAAAYLVERASKQGWEAYGLDLGEWVRQAADLRGVKNVLIGTLVDQHFPDGWFDVVYASQIFEHLQSPMEDLAEISRILKPGGILYIEVPNYRTLPIMANRDDFELNSPPQHINYFTPGALRTMLARSGFRIEEITTEDGLKWENLIGRPVNSEIADAYRVEALDPRDRGQEKSLESSKAHQPSLGKRVLHPLVRLLLYQWAKVGITLYAIARRTR